MAEAQNVNDRRDLIRLLTIVLETPAYESSESEDELYNFPLQILTSENKSSSRIFNYAEEVVAEMCDWEFRRNFRLSRSSVETMEEMIMQDSIFCSTSQTARSVPVFKQILMTLWLLGTPESYRSIASRFGVAESTMWDCCSRMWAAIARQSIHLIRWPLLSELQHIETSFRALSSFPGVIGCVDGTHIEIKAPKMHSEVYINRKSRHSIILQGIVTSNLEFIDCYVGEVGSVHDAKVFRKSNIGQQLSNAVPESYHLLGDKAYPLLLNLLTPFRDNGHLTAQQIRYNTKLSKTRSTVKRAFGLLKGKFRRLKALDMSRTDQIPVVIMACCVLHNLGRNDPFDEDVTVTEDEDSEEETDEDSTLGLQSNRAHEKRHAILQIM